MKYALHLPKQPVLTVFDLQAVHHILPQLVLVLGGKDEPAKLPGSPSPCVVLRNAAARSTLRNTLNCCQTGHLRNVGSPLARFADPRRSPMQRADRPRPRRVLHSRSRRPSANRGPRATGRHGSPTISAGGHCHLPRDDQLPTPPEGDQRARESRACFVVHLHRASFYN